MGHKKSIEQRSLDGVLMRRMGTIAAFAALAGAAKLAQDAAVAWRFGAGAVADAYYFVLSLTNWPLAVALSFLMLVVVPTDVAMRDGDAVAARRFRAELLGATMLLAVLSLPLAWSILYVVVGGQRDGFERSAVAHSGIPGIVALVPLGIVGALLSAWMMALGRQVLTLLEALPPLILAALVVIGPASALFWGLSVGAGVQVLAMAWLLHGAGELPRPRFSFSTDAWAIHSQGVFLLLAGQSLLALVPMVDSFFAVRLGEGEVAAISYVNRLILGLVGLAGLALQRAGLPLLSQLSARSPETALRTALRWTALAALAGAAIGLAVALLAEPLVSLLFGRGRFSAADVKHVAALLRCGMLQVPFYLASLTLATALAGMHERRTLAFFTSCGLVAKVALSAALVPTFGVAGLLLAAALMYGIMSVIGLQSLKRHLHRAVL